MSSIQITAGQRTYSGTITTIAIENEFQYLINLVENLQFTLHISDEGCWESDNQSLDPEIVRHAGETIENMEDLSDVLEELDKLRM